LATVLPTAQLASSGGGLGQKFLVIFKRFDKAVILGQYVLLAILARESLICGLISAKVAALDPQMIGGWDHEAEADDHVEPADKVVHERIVAPNAQRRINTVVDLTLGYTDSVHSDPSQQEHVEPDVEDPCKIVAGVLAANTVVGPKRVSLPPVDTLVADLAVVAARRLDDFAFEAKILARYLLN